jgi:hypothetical protein
MAYYLVDPGVADRQERSSHYAQALACYLKARDALVEQRKPRGKASLALGRCRYRRLKQGFVRDEDQLAELQTALVEVEDAANLANPWRKAEGLVWKGLTFELKAMTLAEQPSSQGLPSKAAVALAEAERAFAEGREIAREHHDPNWLKYETAWTQHLVERGRLHQAHNQPDEAKRSFALARDSADQLLRELAQGDVQGPRPGPATVYQLAQVVVTHSTELAEQVSAVERLLPLFDPSDREAVPYRINLLLQRGSLILTKADGTQWQQLKETVERDGQEGLRLAGNLADEQRPRFEAQCYAVLAMKSYKEDQLAADEATDVRRRLADEAFQRFDEAQKRHPDIKACYAYCLRMALLANRIVSRYERDRDKQAVYARQALNALERIRTVEDVGGDAAMFSRAQQLRQSLRPYLQ